MLNASMSLPLPELTEAQRDALRAAWQRLYKGPREAGDIRIIQCDWDEAPSEPAEIVVHPLHPWGRSGECVAWCAEHGFDARCTYAISIDVDARTITVYQYVRDASGRLERSGDGYRKRDPFTVPLKRLPEFCAAIEEADKQEEPPEA